MELGGRSVLSSFVAAAVADDDVMRVGEGLSAPVVELNWQGICPTVPEHHNTEDEVLLALKKRKQYIFTSSLKFSQVTIGPWALTVT